MSQHEGDKLEKALNAIWSGAQELSSDTARKWTYGSAIDDALRITEEGEFVHEFTIPNDSPAISYGKLGATGRLLLDLHRIGHEEVYGCSLIVQDWSTEHLENESDEDEKKDKKGNI